MAIFLHAGAPLRKLKLLLTLWRSGVTTAKGMLQILSIVDELLLQYIPHCIVPSPRRWYTVFYSISHRQYLVYCT